MVTMSEMRNKLCKEKCASCWLEKNRRFTRRNWWFSRDDLWLKEDNCFTRGILLHFSPALNIIMNSTCAALIPGIARMISRVESAFFLYALLPSTSTGLHCPPPAASFVYLDMFINCISNNIITIVEIFSFFFSHSNSLLFLLQTSILLFFNDFTKTPSFLKIIRWLNVCLREIILQVLLVPCKSDRVIGD